MFPYRPCWLQTPDSFYSRSFYALRKIAFSSQVEEISLVMEWLKDVTTKDIPIYLIEMQA